MKRFSRLARAIGGFVPPSPEDDPSTLDRPHRGAWSRALRPLWGAPLVVVYLLPTLSLLCLGGAPVPVVIASLFLVAVASGLSASRRVPGRRVRIGLLSIALLGTVGWMLASLIPLPIGLLDLLAPVTARVARSGYEAAGRPLPPVAWSLRPGDTAIAIGRTSAVLAACLLLPQVVHRSGSRHLHRALLLVAGALLAVVSWHLATGSELIYGVFEPRGRSASLLLGPFVNSSDLAVLACALTPLAIVEAVRLPGLPRTANTALAFLLAITAILSISRAATLGLAVGVGAVWVALVLLRRLRAAATLAGIGLGGALIAMTLAQQLSPRAHHLVQPDMLLRLDGRAVIWDTAARITESQWITGVGARAFGSAWWSARDQLTDVHPEDAESTPLQYLATLGLPATVVLLLIAAVLMLHVARSGAASARRGDLVPLGAASGLLALVAMAQVTFTTSQPAVSIVAVYLLALTGGEPSRRFAPHRLHWLLVFLVVGAGVLSSRWGASRTEAATDAWFADRLIEDRLQPGDDPIGASLRHPADPYGPAWAAILLRRTEPELAIALVNHALRLDPLGAEPHRAAVNVLLAVSQHSQARLEARLALGSATASELPRLARDAARQWSTTEDLLALLPAEGDAAVRLARELARHVPRDHATELWLAIASRPLPPLFAVGEVLRLLPPARRQVMLAVVRDAALAHGSDPRFAVLEGESLMPEDGVAGAAILRAALQSSELEEDLWRARALLALLDHALKQEVGLGELLAFPTRGGNSESAVRASIEGELSMAHGRISEAVRQFSRAHRLRPDLERFEQRLNDILQSRR